MRARVLISIVAYNSDPCLHSCLESLEAQTFRGFRIAIWDNASTDATRAIIENSRERMGFIHYSNLNLGFCAAHNHLIRSAESDYVLVLNPDVVLEAAFLERMVAWMDRDQSAGSATGKLLRPLNSSGPGAMLDSTGVYFTPSQRHFDRGSDQRDAGQYQKPEYVFGASGAAAFYRRRMLEDVREGTEYFDESFFTYREDADLAWRAQWMGWRCLYVPEAVAYHERRVLPRKRSELPDAINMHSFKNRFLLRVKNMDSGTYARFFFLITLRDASALLYVLARERSSLRGVSLLVSAFPKAWARRKSLQSKRRVSPREIRSWFSYRPVARPIEI